MGIRGKGKQSFAQQVLLCERSLSDYTVWSPMLSVWQVLRCWSFPRVHVWFPWSNLRDLSTVYMRDAYFSYPSAALLPPQLFLCLVMYARACYFWHPSPCQAAFLGRVSSKESKPATCNSIYFLRRKLMHPSQVKQQKGRLLHSYPLFLSASYKQ